MKIKICGLHPARDVQLCIDLKVDFLGFVFYDKSPRNLDLEDILATGQYKNFVRIFVKKCKFCASFRKKCNFEHFVNGR